MLETPLAVWPINLEVAIRHCRRADLVNLEWFGMFRDFRDLFAYWFERHERGDCIMLVADLNAFPVGQVWLDLVKLQPEGIGVLFGLRVLPPLQNHGIGTRLITVAEQVLIKRGFQTVELGVRKDNANARRLYERLGYRVVAENIEEWDYVDAAGQTIHVAEAEWIMRKPLASLVP